MIELKMYDENNLIINADREILFKIREHFSEFKPGFQFSPKFKVGQWDGRIYIFSPYERILPYGLLTEFLALRKKQFPEQELVVDKSVKDFFAQDTYFDNMALVDIEPWEYRPYQEECIRKAMKYKKCIIRAATSAGKSYIITGIIKNLLKANKISNAIIIVPTSALVEQFYKDILDYGYFKEDLGKVYSKFKDWDKKIVISTWQTLKNTISNVRAFDCVIIDEVHGARGEKIRDILRESTAEYKIGCTGTLPDCALEMWYVKGYLGPVVMEVSASELAELGYIANCKVLMYNIEYKSKFSSDYDKAKNEIFKDEFRLNIIDNLLKTIKKTTLLLVGKVETEGVFLKNHMLEQEICDEDHIVFISGTMDVSIREEWRQKIINNPDEKFVVIATYGTFSTGINVPNLSNLIFASPFKAKIRILQSIGRVLRKHITKNSSGAVIYDLVDLSNKWFGKYGDIRLRFYDNEKFEVIEKTIKQP